ncbi:MAG: hypothetical protein COB22_05900 [Cycloclasticus sp.]|nr:MAG: hypothetical protein COB22_05900 [Cycloclasticus sp.]
MSLVNVGTKGHIDYSDRGTASVKDFCFETIYYKLASRKPSAPLLEQRQKKGKKGKMLKDWE